MEFQKEIRKNIDKNEIGTYISTVGKIKGSLIHGFYGNTIQKILNLFEIFPKICHETFVGNFTNCDLEA